MSLRTATASINLSALSHNLKAIKKKAPDSKILAVLKANAYGHGLERIAQALPDVDALGVARIDEALALRVSGVVKPIVLLEGFFSKNDLAKLSANNLQTIIHNKEQLQALCAAKLAKPLKVWLKVDTGMHRLGINPEEFSYFYQQLSDSENVQKEIVLMSHLACADDLSSQVTTEQIALFDQLTADLPDDKSMANSAGLCAWPQSYYQWVRPGLTLYGISPMQDVSPSLSVEPVMTLQSSLIAIRSLNKGETVGYGGAWCSEKDTKIGVIAIGYGDGYPRHAKNGTPVLINGRRVSLIGRVSMDMITVNLGIDSTDEIGDVATLWGKSLPIEEIAECASTISYELLCNITRRVQMIIV